MRFALHVLILLYTYCHFVSCWVFW